MRILYFTILLGLSTFISSAQAQHTMFAIENLKENNINEIYKLFPTQNYWTFIKLNTRNGKLWQVHFTVNDEGDSGEVILNSIPLVELDEETNGRFTLYPTENIYNFILLDQINGNVYQIQWSMEEKFRGVIPIY